MQSYNETEFKICKENSLYEFIAYTAIGDREEQQDSFGFKLKNDSLIAVVCDGMGGHNRGNDASILAVNELMNILERNKNSENVPGLFLEALKETDIKVASITDESGEPVRAGTTAIAVMIKGHDLYWCSVGDSRIYIIRGNEMIQATCDHTYKLILDSRLAGGEITQDEYEKNAVMGNVLVSFLGAGKLPLTDINQVPFKLTEGDMIILMSDGLYKYLSDDEMKNIIINFRELNDAVEALDAKVKRISRKKQSERDNMTVIIIKIKGDF